ncbi:MAG: pyrimidine-nucleoside phosphorylase, partial [Lachnospiraceae bacterium]|nr:pyrimidine-nucleoside phosphorylase [Lachnospiraceae bacterium]
YMLVAGGKAATKEEAGKVLAEVIENGSALDKLAEFIEAQGGDQELVYHPERLPQASIAQEIESPTDGYIQKIVCDEIGICSLILGGGRETKESEIDLSVGLVLHKKVGDAVKKGDSLATIYANDQTKLDAAKERFLQAYTIDRNPVEKKPLIKGIVIE